MVCHLLPFFEYQPSFTAISMETAGDSRRSPVSFSMAQATHTLLCTRTLFLMVSRWRRPLAPSFHSKVVYSMSASPRSLISKRSGENRPHPLIAAMIHCDDQDG